jgi:hypothetical protein
METNMDNKLQFLPFHAINEFMRPDFRLSVIRDVLNNTNTLPSEQALAVANITKRTVKVPGFRNSEKAPNLVKVMPMVKSFAKSPELVGIILSAWAAVHNDLFDQVYSLLKHRNWPLIEAEQDISFATLSSDILNKWPILPPGMDRKSIPGFLPRWPKGEDFETLYTTYKELYPSGEASIDQVSLMAVWLALRLPYTIEETPTQSDQVNNLIDNA